MTLTLSIMEWIGLVIIVVCGWKALEFISKPDTGGYFPSIMPLFGCLFFTCLALIGALIFSCGCATIQPQRTEPPAAMGFAATAAPSTLTVAVHVRDYDDTWRPSTAAVLCWPADAAGDSVASDRRVYDAHWWAIPRCIPNGDTLYPAIWCGGSTWVTTAVEAKVKRAWPNEWGVASFTGLTAGAAYYVWSGPRALGYGTLAIKPALARVDLAGDTLFLLEAR